ncbi:MAG: phosphotransferase [Lachnospiraceae bacterium]|nr:phosphotransferase [Lachnospiraceae bacterium]
MKELDKSYFWNKEVIDLFTERNISISNIDCIVKGKCNEQSFKLDTNQGKYFVKFSNSKRFSKTFLSALEIANGKIGNIIQLPIATYDLKELNRQINIYNWIEGTNLKEILKTCCDDECIYYGNRCGKLMRKIHFSLTELNGLQYCIVSRLKKYYKRIDMLGFKFEYEFDYRKYLENNLDILVRDINPCFIHLDFKPKNLMINKNKIYVVDIDSSMLGDPWLDFYDKAFSLYPSKELFNAALIKSYFDGDVPELFWRYFRVLSVFALIQNTAWILPKKDYTYIKNLESYLWNAYDGFKELIHRWYC